MHPLLTALVLASAPDGLNLGEWIALALEHSTVPVRNESSRMQAEASYGSARASLLPRITLSNGVGWTWSDAESSSPAGSPDGPTWSAGISLSQEILASGGSDWISLQAASLGRDLADLQGRAALLSLERDVAEDYYAVVEAAWQVRSAESALDRSEALLERVELLFELGSGTAIDRLSARVQATGDELALLERTQQLSNALAELRLTAGVSGQDSFSVDTSAVPELLGIEEARALRETPGANPDLGASAVSAEQAGLSLRAASRSWMPSLAAGASWSWAGDELDPLHLGSEDSWGVSLSLTMPLFDGWELRSRVRSAEASLLESQAALQSALDETATALAIARTALLSSIERAALADLELEYAGQELELARMRFELGELDVAGLLETQADFSAAESARISARIACLSAEVDYLVLNGSSPRVGE